MKIGDRKAVEVDVDIEGIYDLEEWKSLSSMICDRLDSLEDSHIQIDIEYDTYYEMQLKCTISGYSQVTEQEMLQWQHEQAEKSRKDYVDVCKELAGIIKTCPEAVDVYMNRMIPLRIAVTVHRVRELVDAHPTALEQAWKMVEHDLRLDERRNRSKKTVIGVS